MTNEKIYKKLTIKDLNFENYFLVKSKAQKIVIFIPEILNESGQVAYLETFTDKDKSIKNVNCDGTQVIIVNPIDHRNKLLHEVQIKEICKKINNRIKLFDKSSSQNWQNLLEYIHNGLKLEDIYGTDVKYVQQNMALITNDEGMCGLYKRNNNILKAIYVAGEGEFSDGPADTPQKFENGAYFLQDEDGKKWLVQADIFKETYLNADETPINFPEWIGTYIDNIDEDIFTHLIGAECAITD